MPVTTTPSVVLVGTAEVTVALGIAVLMGEASHYPNRRSVGELGTRIKLSVDRRVVSLAPQFRHTHPRLGTIYQPLGALADIPPRTSIPTPYSCPMGR